MADDDDWMDDVAAITVPTLPQAAPCPPSAPARVPAASVPAAGTCSATQNTAARTKPSGERVAEPGIVLARKVTISSMMEHQQQATKVAGIPPHHRLHKLLSKMKAHGILPHGGHVAKDDVTGLKFLVLHGSVAEAVAAFLVREGVAGSGSIAHA